MQFRSVCFSTWVGAGALLLFACAEGQDLTFPPSSAGAGGSGDQTGTGGGGGSSGGSGGSAGATNGGGGTSAGGSAVNTGGSSAGAGGAVGGGGSAGRGGSGGSSGSSGSTGTGGSGGSTGTGGSLGTGGARCGSAPPFDAGSGQVLLFDSFEADSGAPGWIPTSTSSSQPGMWSLIAGDGGGRVYAQQAAGTGSAVLMSVNGNLAWTDQTIEAKVLVTSWAGSSTSNLVGVCGRYAGPTNYYCAALRGDGKFALRARINDSGTTLNSGAPTVAAATLTGMSFTLKIEIRGTTINGYYNGATVPTATVTDATICSGGVALMVEGATVQFDDVKVTVP